MVALLTIVYVQEGMMFLDAASEDDDDEGPLPPKTP